MAEPTRSSQLPVATMSPPAGPQRRRISASLSFKDRVATFDSFLQNDNLASRSCLEDEANGNLPPLSGMSPRRHSLGTGGGDGLRNGITTPQTTLRATLRGRISLPPTAPNNNPKGGVAPLPLTMTPVGRLQRERISAFDNRNEPTSQKSGITASSPKKKPLPPPLPPTSSRPPITGRCIGRSKSAADKSPTLLNKLPPAFASSQARYIGRSKSASVRAPLSSSLHSPATRCSDTSGVSPTVLSTSLHNPGRNLPQELVSPKTTETKQRRASPRLSKEQIAPFDPSLLLDGSASTVTYDDDDENMERNKIQSSSPRLSKERFLPFDKKLLDGALQDERNQENLGYDKKNKRSSSPQLARERISMYEQNTDGNPRRSNSYEYKSVRSMKGKLSLPNCMPLTVPASPEGMSTSETRRLEQDRIDAFEIKQEETASAVDKIPHRPRRRSIDNADGGSVTSPGTEGRAGIGQKLSRPPFANDNTEPTAKSKHVGRLSVQQQPCSPPTEKNLPPKRIRRHSEALPTTTSPSASATRNSRAMSHSSLLDEAEEGNASEHRRDRVVGKLDITWPPKTRSAQTRLRSIHKGLVAEKAVKSRRTSFEPQLLHINTVQDAMHVIEGVAKDHTTISASVLAQAQKQKGLARSSLRIRYGGQVSCLIDKIFKRLEELDIEFDPDLLLQQDFVTSLQQSFSDLSHQGPAAGTDDFAPPLSPRRKIRTSTRENQAEEMLLMSPRRKARADNFWYDEEESEDRDVEVGRLGERTLSGKQNKSLEVGRLPRHNRPDIWVTPNFEDPIRVGKQRQSPESKSWRVKRVWNFAPFDDHETECQVRESDLMDKVKLLLGTFDNAPFHAPWLHFDNEQHGHSNTDPLPIRSCTQEKQSDEIGAAGDSKRKGPWGSQWIYDVGGEIEEPIADVEWMKESVLTDRFDAVMEAEEKRVACLAELALKAEKATAKSSSPGDTMEAVAETETIEIDNTPDKATQMADSTRNATPSLGIGPSQSSHHKKADISGNWTHGDGDETGEEEESKWGSAPSCEKTENRIEEAALVGVWSHGTGSEPLGEDVSSGWRSAITGVSSGRAKAGVAGEWNYREGEEPEDGASEWGSVPEEARDSRKANLAGDGGEPPAEIGSRTPEPSNSTSRTRKKGQLKGNWKYGGCSEPAEEDASEWGSPNAVARASNKAELAGDGKHGEGNGLEAEDGSEWGSGPADTEVRKKTEPAGHWRYDEGDEPEDEGASEWGSAPSDRKAKTRTKVGLTGNWSYGNGDEPDVENASAWGSAPSGMKTRARKKEELAGEWKYGEGGKPTLDDGSEWGSVPSDAVGRIGKKAEPECAESKSTEKESTAPGATKPKKKKTRNHPRLGATGWSSPIFSDDAGSSNKEKQKGNQEQVEADSETSAGEMPRFDGAWTYGEGEEPGEEDCVSDLLSNAKHDKKAELAGDWKSGDGEEPEEGDSTRKATPKDRKKVELSGEWNFGEGDEPAAEERTSEWDTESPRGTLDAPDEKEGIVGDWNCDGDEPEKDEPVDEGGIVQSEAKKPSKRESKSKLRASNGGWTSPMAVADAGGSKKKKRPQKQKEIVPTSETPNGEIEKRYLSSGGGTTTSVADVEASVYEETPLAEIKPPKREKVKKVKQSKVKEEGNIMDLFQPKWSMVFFKEEEDDKIKNWTAFPHQPRSRKKNGDMGMTKCRLFQLRFTFLFFLLLSSAPLSQGDKSNNKDDDPRVGQYSDWERERLAEYYKRNYTWPVTAYRPYTYGWKKVMDHRFRQIEEMELAQSRYEGYAQTISAALVQPNLTRYGFGLARAPNGLMEELRQAIHDGLSEGPREETGAFAISGPNLPWFIDKPDLMNKVLYDLQHYVEAWAKMEVIPAIAYGLRVYRNESQLWMHVDRSNTHILSFILHIDSSDDSQPWPLTIEDLHGDTHEIVLTSGDLVLYESSKVFHGRPRVFRGSWYTSVFVHYYPKYGWSGDDFHNKEKLYAVPPHWRLAPGPMKFEIPLEMIGTSMREPTCPNQWCSTQYSYKWSGPGEEGFIITPTRERIPFHPKKDFCEDLEQDCQRWVQLGTNECLRNPGFMRYHCKKSCGVCSTNSTDLQHSADEKVSGSKT